ncbi:hypothetical protein BH24BAC1_BH24BAC1_03720 [soil metagenome]
MVRQKLLPKTKQRHTKLVNYEDRPEGPLN